MAQLARKLTLWNYFALGFGTMIGTGWIILMDDWLERGGPGGAMLGFLLGGILFVPIGYTYGQWVRRLPDAAGEAAYAERVFPSVVSYFAGWMMLLAYFIVCPWEAVAIGKLAAYIFPGLDVWELYRIAGQPVYLPRLLLGVLLILALGWLNYRGMRASAVFQNWVTSSVLLIFLLLVFVSAGYGSVSNIRPLFPQAPITSVLLTLQIVPYWLVGFESVPKVAEEAHPGFPPGNFFKAIALALLVGASFYVFAIGAVSYIVPWQGLLGHRFATVLAFGQATHSVWFVRLILCVSLIGLVQVFNGNFVAASRLLFAFGRKGTVPARFGAIHPKHQTPALAIAGIAAATLAGLLLGDSLLVPVTEVGALASLIGWLTACVSFIAVEPRARPRLIAFLGVVVSVLLIVLKLVPAFPGHFTRAEWIALLLWLALGLALRRRPSVAAA